MPANATLEPASDGSLGEYGPRLRISLAARATVLDAERRRFHQDLDLLRTRASERR
ncbi:MAG TPA: hypothetical protein VM143_02890 [Acidimicrobiales bacterium]|nr:hypothetical protein [Acidimicrobiales bacterium]